MAWNHADDNLEVLYNQFYFHWINWVESGVRKNTVDLFSILLANANTKKLWMNLILISNDLLTLWLVPAMYNCRNGSCSSNKLVTLLCNGIEPNKRTAKLHVASSLATSVNMRSICFWTLLFTHSTPYSMILAAVVVVVVVCMVRVTLIGFPRW